MNNAQAEMKNFLLPISDRKQHGDWRLIAHMKADPLEPNDIKSVELWLHCPEGEDISFYMAGAFLLHRHSSHPLIIGMGGVGTPGYLHNFIWLLTDMMGQEMEIHSPIRFFLDSPEPMPYHDIEAEYEDERND